MGLHGACSAPGEDLNHSPAATCGGFIEGWIQSDLGHRVNFPDGFDVERNSHWILEGPPKSQVIHSCGGGNNMSLDRGECSLRGRVCGQGGRLCVKWEESITFKLFVMFSAVHQDETQSEQQNEEEQKNSAQIKTKKHNQSLHRKNRLSLLWC